jgi:hypothetical protein
MTGSLTEQLDRIKEAGYDGIESPLPESISAFKNEVNSRGLKYVGMLFAHDAESLEGGVAQAIDCGVTQLTVHSGRDNMSFDEGSAYFEAALKIEEKYGLRMCHETHRGRILFNPWTTAAYLRRFPELKIVADFSHFTCVCERLLNVDDPDLKFAYGQTYHLHTRVGYDQGPQVPDPRAPEFAWFVERFDAYWDAIRDAHIARGEQVITVDPEFGPPGYMHTLPYTQQPVADLWDICQWMTDRIRKRWSNG